MTTKVESAISNILRGESVRASVDILLEALTTPIAVDLSDLKDGDTVMVKTKDGSYAKMTVSNAASKKLKDKEGKEISVSGDVYKEV